MIKSNKRWLLTASPWMKNGLRLSPLGIGGLLLCALFLFSGNTVFAQGHSGAAGLTDETGVHYSGISGTVTTLGSSTYLPVITTGTGTTICMGTTTSLSDAVTGGTWSSSNPAVGTVDPALGIVTGIRGGITLITYTVGSLYVTTLITVTYPIAATVTSVCTGNSIFLVDSMGSGIWTSSNTAVATISPYFSSTIPTGQVTGVAAGSAVITYGRSGACFVTTTVTVNANHLGAITGLMSGVCVGGTTLASDTTAGNGWSSSNTSIATIGSTGTITGVNAGGATITFSASGCYVTNPVVVNSPSSISAITGLNTVCVGTTLSLSDATHLGTWGISNTSLATINAAGTVSGLVPGNDTVSYYKGGCAVTKAITITANNVGAVSGSAYVCSGQTITVSDTTSGGAWTSSNPAIATVGSTGIVTGIAAGTSGMTYTIITYTVGGCYKTTSVTVTPTTSVGSIYGTTTLCQGLTTSLTDSVAGGVWSSSNPAVGSIAIYGQVGGVSAGTTVITYTRLGCAITTTVTINPLPSPITGTNKECANVGTTTLADPTTGGTWSSSNTAIATIGTNGVVTGVTSGIINITYTLPTTCFVKTTDTVYAPASITGGNVACVGVMTYLELHDATMTTTGTEGTWSSGTAGVASISSGGAVTGVSAGTSIISYKVVMSGLTCYAFDTVTVNYAPGLISGNTNVCSGSTTTLTDTTAAGVWTSANPSVATVGSSTGIVSGVASGATVMTYTKNGCYRTTNVLVGAALPAITGNATVCASYANTTLTETTTGGTWSFSSSVIELVQTGSTTAMVTGVSAGSATVSYSLAGCIVTKVMTITKDSATTIAGSNAVCVGATTTLTSGGGLLDYGTWSSSSPLVSFTVFNDSNAYVTGVTAGTTVITYMLASGCFKYLFFNVHPSPATISGAYTMCNSATTTLTDATSGGTWSTSNTHIATVGTNGVVTAVTAGHVSIGYMLDGGCITYQPIDIMPMPNAYGSATAVCVGGTATLADSLRGGTWSSSNTAVGTIDPTLGIVGGISAGSTIITYTVGTCYVSKAFTVGGVPVSFSGTNPGPISVCAMGTASNPLTVSTSGGSWATANSAIASISNGAVTGVAAGTVIISYTLNGCFATQTETVAPNTMPGITGLTAICTTGLGDSTLLSEATTGGTWGSSNTAFATVNATTGEVYAVSVGAVVISYAVPNGGCRQFYSLNIGNVTPNIINGNVPICAGGSFTLTDTMTGGNWTSSNPSVAYVISSGVVGGISAGSATITYSVNGCFPAPVTVTVNPLPAAITGTFSVCENHSVTSLSETTPGGAWSSSAPTKGTVDGSGNVTGLLYGSTNIDYTLPTGCLVSAAVTVGGNAATLGGPTSLCNGTTITLTTNKSGGTWSSGNPSVATISSSGVVSGISGGVVLDSYTTPGCAAVTYSVTVNYVAPIGSSPSVCKTDSLQLTEATTGGVWTTSNSTILAVGSATGMVYGMLAGMDTITYTASGCAATSVITVEACGHRLTGGNGVTGVTENQKFTLFPNPANSEITISQEVEVDGAMQVSLMNEVGNVVYNGTLQFAGGKAQFNVNVAGGLYIVLLRDDKGSVQTMRVVIEK